MQVLVERIGDRYRASSFTPFHESAEADTREEALFAIEAAINRHLGDGAELVDLSLPRLSAQHRPWLQYAGDLRDNSLFDAWQESIRQARRQRDLEDGIEYVSEAL